MNVEMSATNLMALLGEPGRTAARELFVYLMIFMVPAVILFVTGVTRENQGGKGWLKFTSLIPLGIMAAIGWPYTFYLLSEFEMTANPIGGSSLTAYRLALPIPVVLIVAVIVYGVLRAKLSKRERDEL